MHRSFLLALALFAVAPGVASAADGAPPREAVIVPGESIAGVELGQRARIPASNDRMRGPVIGNWGRASGGYCFLDLQCAWKVPGRGSAYVDLGDEDSRRVSSVATTAPRWFTATGTHVGVSADRVRDDYPASIAREVCFGGDARAVLLADGRRTTVFVIERGLVAKIAVSPSTVDELAIPC